MRRRVLYNLPEDLLFEILFRLPSKYILRCKNVCKSWYSIITSKKFIKNHLEFSANRSKNNPCSVTLVLGWTSLNLPEDRLNYDSDGDPEYDVDIPRDQTLAFAVLQTKDNAFRSTIQTQSLGNLRSFIQGCDCNGINCFVILSDSRPRDKIRFYNLTIRESHAVWSYSNMDDYSVMSFGLGYDARADDYKYVSLLQGGTPFRYKADVYSLETGCWREIEFEERTSNIIGNGLYLRGFLHFLEVGRSILLFDVSEEKFHRIPLPSQVGNDSRIVLWNGSIALLSSPDDTKTYGMSVLNYDGKGNDVTWTEHVTIGMPESIGIPTLFWKNDELLVREHEEDGAGVFSYNLNTKAVNKLPIQQAMADSTLIASIFIESLVSVKPKGTL